MKPLVEFPLITEKLMNPCVIKEHQTATMYFVRKEVSKSKCFNIYII